MINCPKCDEKLRVLSEFVYSGTDEYEWKKGKGIKKKNFSKKYIYLEETRVFLKCTKCDFITENLNGYDYIEDHEEECELIVDQIRKCVKKD